jgi:hypothetical protein
MELALEGDRGIQFCQVDAAREAGIVLGAAVAVHGVWLVLCHTADPGGHSGHASAPKRGQICHTASQPTRRLIN